MFDFTQVVFVSKTKNKSTNQKLCLYLQCKLNLTKNPKLVIYLLSVIMSINFEFSVETSSDVTPGANPVKTFLCKLHQI